MRVTMMMPRRVFDESTARDDHDSTRDSSLSLSRDEYSFSRSPISSLASVCPHRARASFGSVRSIHARDHRAVRAIGTCVEFARSRRARDGSTSTTTRNDDGSFLCSSFGDSRARAFAGARLGRACCDDRRRNHRVGAATTDRPLGSSGGRGETRARARRGRRGGCVNERTSGRADERRRMDGDRITLNHSWTRNRRRD